MNAVLFRLLSSAPLASVVLLLTWGWVGLPLNSWAANKVEPASKSMATLSETLALTAPVPEITLTGEAELAAEENPADIVTLRQGHSTFAHKKTEKPKTSLFAQWGRQREHSTRPTSLQAPATTAVTAPNLQPVNSTSVPLPVPAVSSVTAKGASTKKTSKHKAHSKSVPVALQPVPLPVSASSAAAAAKEETLATTVSTMGVFMAQSTEPTKLSMASYDSFSSASGSRWAGNGGLADSFSNSAPSTALLQELRASWSPSPANRWQAINSLERFIQQYNPALPLVHRTGLAKAILELSEQQGLDYRLTASMMAVESGFKLHAISSSGAIGLGQLKDFTARWLRVTNPFDPVENLQGMTAYLRYLVGLFPEDLHKAIGSYYVGQGAMQRQGMTADAAAYVQKVQLAYSRLRTS